MSDSEEEEEKLDIYRPTLKLVKEEIIDEISDKIKKHFNSEEKLNIYELIKNINYKKKVLDNLVYDPDEGIEKDVIEDLQDRMIDELQYHFQSKVEELFESEPEPEPGMGESKKKKNKSKRKRKKKSKRNTKNTINK
jgi:hypothetical protein